MKLFYSTWYKYYRSVFQRSFDNDPYVSSKDGKKDSSIELIGQGLNEQYGQRLGHHHQYRDNFLLGTRFGILFGPVRDQYYHQTTKRLKAVYNFLRYDNKDDFDQVAKRAREEYLRSMENEDKDPEEEEFIKEHFPNPASVIKNGIED